MPATFLHPKSACVSCRFRPVDDGGSGGCPQHPFTERGYRASAATGVIGQDCRRWRPERAPEVERPAALF